MPAVLSVPRRRLRRKVWLGFEIMDADPSDWGTPVQGPIANYVTEEELEQENSSAAREVYLVTLPAISRAGDGGALTSGLVCPSTWRHDDIARVLLHSFKSPVRSHNNQGWGGETVVPDFFVDDRERHAPRAGEAVGPYHWHIGQCDDNISLW